MRATWAVILYTMRDGIRRKAWFPFAVLILLGAALIVMQFGFTVQITGATHWADNIISSFFFFWAWGTFITTVSLGATSIPNERRSQTLFTLPISRWELVAGKIIGTQILASVILAVGYAISIGLAYRQHLAVTPYAHFGFVTAFTAVFVVLCLSVPLGVRVSSMVAGTLTAVLLMLNSILEGVGSATDTPWMRAAGSMLPWQIPPKPINFAFFDSVNMPSQYIDYPLLVLNALIAVAFLFAMTLLTRKMELPSPEGRG